MKIDPKTAKKELEKRQLQKAKSLNFVLDDFLFDKQRNFVNDPEPFKIAVCSRRSGKTVACAAHLTHTAISNENVICLYITLSRSNAEKIIWKELQTINTNYKLGGVVNKSKLSITFQNGSVIYCSGAKDKTEIENFRGISNLKLCYIDECQSFKEYIEELIDDVIGPALMDLAGTLCLIGTPSPLPKGYFYDTSFKDNSWSKHAWTFWDNPFIASKSKKTHQEILDRELKRRGVAVSDSSIQREWFGRWTQDSDSLIIRYNPEKNDYNTLPQAKYNYILGIDLGFKDADALAVLAWSDFDPTTYLVEEKITAKQDITDLVEQINQLRKKYDIYKMVIDEGGLGKKLAEELRKRHHIPVEAAEKSRKMENIAFLNDALRTGIFKANKNSTFVSDSYLLEVDWDKSTPDKIKVSSSFHSDIIDAVLYAFKLSPAYAYQPPANKPQYGTPEWANQEVDEMEQAAEEYFKRLEEEEQWDF